MKKLVVLMLSMIMVIVMAGCGGSGESAPSGDAGNDSAAMINVVIEIDYPDNSGIADVDDLRIQVPEGASALDVLHIYGEENNVEVIMSDTSKTAYVTTINGVTETSDAGWIYEVNDESTMDAANEYIVTEGMEISWDYTSWSDMD